MLELIEDLLDENIALKDDIIVLRKALQRCVPFLHEGSLAHQAIEALEQTQRDWNTSHEHQ